MKEKILYLLLASVFTFYSCDCQENKGNNLNGIYQTNVNGVEFKFFNDTTKSIRIDTLPLVSCLYFENVEIHIQSEAGEPMLHIQLTDCGKKKFTKITKNNIGKQLAIILDGKLLSAPVVRETITNGRIYVSGVDKEFAEKVVRDFEKNKVKCNSEATGFFR